MKVNLLALLVIFVMLRHYTASAQYTNTLNTNFPGQSQGAYAPGLDVLQLETSIFYRTEDHDLQNYQRDILGTAFQLRYGFLFERLEVSYFGTYESVNVDTDLGFRTDETSYSNFSRSTIGAKFMVFDPARWFVKEVDLRSYRANNSLTWRDFIPTISVYAGANLDFNRPNSLLPPRTPELTPRFEFITQHNLGRWVLVTNLIADRLGAMFPSSGGVVTLTHSFNSEWAAFGEFQWFNSGFYSDDIARFGGAYLINRNMQVDASAALNFKDTPGLYQVNLGFSYRLDYHQDPEFHQNK